MERPEFMSDLPHIPALRRGVTYASLNTTPVVDCRTGEVLAEVSQVNAGVVRRDLARIRESRDALKALSVDSLISLSEEAGERFMNDSLPLGDRGHRQAPEDYVRTLSATSGLPHVMVRRNMTKIHAALSNTRTVLNGLTRGMDLSILDRGYGDQNGARVCFYPTASCLGLVMPSNSPAVNSLWLPAIALKSPVVLKPGREEPWTPYRLIQAFIAAGCPAEAFGFYPTDHEGAGDILRLSGRALIFGDKATTDQYAGNPGIQVHGPGFSKILIGNDAIEDWADHIDLMASSVCDNGGRSCVNASAIVVPKYGREIAEALAERLGPVKPLPVDAEDAVLSGFANPRMAEAIDAVVEADLREAGSVECTERFRDGARLSRFEGGTYLRPTVVHCESFDHPLANREFLFPYASVVEVPQAEMLDRIGPTLVVSAVTRDPAFTRELLESPLIERLNLGPISTMKISWDQPHEGNMFEFLYRRRSFDHAAEAA